MTGRAAIALGLVAALAALPASAAPLCRDSKGLFTPCPRGTNAHARAIIKRAADEKAPAAKADATTEATPTAREPARKASSGAIRKAKLCRDTKGLFTPCAR